MRNSAILDQINDGAPLDDGLLQTLQDGGVLAFNDFAAVSQSFLTGYAAIVRRGLPDQVVARAMLDATVNLYGFFDIQDELPLLFRLLADRLEAQAAVKQ